ncbi:MAG: hypothetical protein HYU28_00355 [Actinobacteria bacterium]|nr:hypothetical protein [Actinomycetota bacterium]
MAENPKVKDSAAAGFTPADSPMTYEDYLASESHRALSTPAVVIGEPAHDFALPVDDFSDGTRRETGKVFRLQEVAANQPVALIFGSYT